LTSCSDDESGPLELDFGVVREPPAPLRLRVGDLFT
jgi:hypothetical protein